jgi:hypothetical protein
MNAKDKAKPLKERVKSRNIGSEKGGRKISLYPLDIDSALRAAIATGPITDPKVKPPKRSPKTRP